MMRNLIFDLENGGSTYTRVNTVVVYHFILTDSEFNAMVGSWPDRCHDLDRYNLFPNSNKYDKCDSDVMLHSP